MADTDDATDPNPTGASVEFALSDLRVEAQRGLAPQEQLRDHLPGLEPERHVTEWGPSEGVAGLVDRTLYHFLYHYWFRVEIAGIDNGPEDGGALPVSNHAGAVPPDEIMIAKALRQQHPRTRLCRVAAFVNA